LPIEAAWPVSALHEAVPLLARNAALLPNTAAPTADLQPFAEPEPNQELISAWLENAAKQLGLESLAAETAYADMEQLLASGGPALFLLPAAESSHAPRFIAAVGSSRSKVRLLGRDSRIHAVDIKEVRRLLTQELEAPLLPAVEAMLDTVDAHGGRRAEARQSLLRECLAAAKIDGCWLLRLPPSANFLQQLGRADFLQQSGWLISAILLNRLFMLAASVLIGRTLLQGRPELTAMQIWGLLLLSMIPLQLVTVQIKNRLSLRFGVLLRSRLLSGILQLKAAEIRHQGSGHFLGNVQEMEKLEALGMSMAFAAFTACMEALIAAMVLMFGSGGFAHGVLLLAWLTGIGLLSRSWHQRMLAWQNHHRQMTCDLVERMAGHRTRLAQERPQERHKLEDQLLAKYAMLAKRADIMQAAVESASGRRGWLPVSLLFTAFTAGSDLTLLAVSLGGTLLAASALDQCTQSIRQLIEAVISWQQVHPLHQSAERERAQKAVKYISPARFKQRQEAGSPIIAADEVSFAYPGPQAVRQPVLEQCSLTVQAGQHLLLEGASGSGKSTLAALLSGLELPDSGTLRLFGLSRAVLGEEAWRRRVVIAPQFHQNYVLTETFAFNLLMGRAWPPSEEDLAEAEAVCQELKLGELLETMPAGIQQMVGEGGWRLSHGERSRLFVARTLLQQADLIILDESFAALDPETLHVALDCVLRRSCALLLIAHP
jgi:ATP-binding cassette subfamily B protein